MLKGIESIHEKLAISGPFFSHTDPAKFMHYKPVPHSIVDPTLQIESASSVRHIQLHSIAYIF
jgi:hypothetical protein